MKKWEYTITQVWPANEHEHLEHMGIEGWELVAILSNKNLLDYYWKRELPDNTETK